MGDRGAEGNVLVDTSVWIEFFRKDTATSRALEALIKAGRVVVPGIVVFELLQGVKPEKEKGRIMDLLSNLDYVEMSKDLWASAAVLSRSLKDKGLNLPLSDVLLAAIALKHNLPLFTLDAHFDSMAEVKRYEPGTARR